MMVYHNAACSAPSVRVGHVLRGLYTTTVVRRLEASLPSSASVFDHKEQRRLPHRSLFPLPSIQSPLRETTEAAGNLLYKTPTPSPKQMTRYTLTALVQDEPGVLSRVSGALATRGVNIDSLMVCSTKIAELSRMCIMFKGQKPIVEQARRQLQDLVPVWAVLDHMSTKTIKRELMLIKVSLLGPEYFQDQVKCELAISQWSLPPDVQAGQTFVPARPPGPPPGDRLSPTHALRIKGEHLRHIVALAQQFQGRVVDVSSGSVIVEMCGKTGRCDAMLKLLRPFGIIECARSGTMVLPRAQLGEEDQEPVVEQT